MIRVVMDTNVLASGFVGFAKTERAPARLLRLWRDQRFDLVVSADIIVELMRTFEDPYFCQRLTSAEIAEAERLLREIASLTQFTTPVLNVATHIEEDRIVAAAVSASADYLVTGDSKLQHLGRFQGVTILSPRAFLDVLDLTVEPD